MVPSITGDGGAIGLGGAGKIQRRDENPVGVRREADFPQGAFDGTVEFLGVRQLRVGLDNGRQNTVAAA